MTWKLIEEFKVKCWEPWDGWVKYEDGTIGRNHYSWDESYDPETSECWPWAYWDDEESKDIVEFWDSRTSEPPEVKTP